MRLRDRHAVVTGAGRGLGRAIAEAFVAEGARVLALARTGSDLVALEKAFPGRVIGRALDVTDRSALDALPELVAGTLGRLDVLVNNAGILAPASRLEGLGLARIQRLFSTNVFDFGEDD